MQLEQTAAADVVSVDAAILTLVPRYQTGQPLIVVGRVDDIRTKYDRWNYGKLAGTDASIAFKLPKSELPQLGQQIAIRGVLDVRPSRISAGLEVCLVGTLLGEFVTKETSPPVELARRREPLRLGQFIGRMLETAGDVQVTALCTEVGQRDAASACRRFGVEPGWMCVVGNFADREALLRTIRGVRPGHGALAVLRGGGDQRSLGIWNDPEIVAALMDLELPFFTALGHSTDLLLADRYADEAFDTPTSFGSAVGQVIAERKARLEAKAQEDVRFRQMEEQHRLQLSLIERTYTEQVQNVRRSSADQERRAAEAAAGARRAERQAAAKSAWRLALGFALGIIVAVAVGFAL